MGAEERGSCQWQPQPANGMAGVRPQSLQDWALPRADNTRGEETPDGKAMVVVRLWAPFLLFPYFSHFLQRKHYFCTTFII